MAQYSDCHRDGEALQSEQEIFNFKHSRHSSHLPTQLLLNLILKYLLSYDAHY